MSQKQELLEGTKRISKKFSSTNVANSDSNIGMIGLEIHVYPITEEKLFCRCKASRGKNDKANTNICPVCTGQPGAKPMLPNKEAVKKAIEVALMLGCKVSERMPWQRKHYSWPDLPKGYQNTLSGNGAVPVGVKGNFHGINITEIHLEEDPAAWDPQTGRVDYNRSGLPLLEIVTEPDFSTAEEAMDWLNKLVHSLSYLKAVDGDAGIKVDTNVSTTFSKGSRSPKESTKRVEMKNINSIESIGRAIDYELERQSREGQDEEETRRFDPVSGKTVKMRSKEDAEDYRFIRDPDLLDLNLDKSWIDELGKNLPEMPEDKLDKLVKKYKLSKEDSKVLAKNIDLVEFFEDVVESSKLKAGWVLDWVTIELLRVLNYNKKSLEEVSVEVSDFIKLLNLIESGKITETQGKKILNDFVPKSFDPSKKVESKISNTGELEKIVSSVISGNAKAVSDYSKGVESALNFLVGQVMGRSKGRADVGKVREILVSKLR